MALGPDPYKPKYMERSHKGTVSSHLQTRVAVQQYCSPRDEMERHTTCWESRMSNRDCRLEGINTTLHQAASQAGPRLLESSRKLYNVQNTRTDNGRMVGRPLSVGSGRKNSSDGKLVMILCCKVIRRQTVCCEIVSDVGKRAISRTQASGTRRHSDALATSRCCTVHCSVRYCSSTQSVFKRPTDDCKTHMYICTEDGLLAHSTMIAGRFFTPSVQQHYLIDIH